MLGERRVAVYDYGVKRHILRSFAGLGAAVRVFPAGTPFADVWAWEPDGVFFSNGPGDPRAMPQAVETVRHAIASGLPLFGICLGHQLLALAEGLEVYKMKVGHRGANHPVLNLTTGRVEISTQNHGFAVREQGVDGVAEVAHRNLNDGTVEGLRYLGFPGFSVQYHPEACPGPHDSRYLFDQFFEMMDGEPARAPPPPRQGKALAETCRCLSLRRPPTHAASFARRVGRDRQRTVLQTASGACARQRHSGLGLPHPSPTTDAHVRKVRWPRSSALTASLFLVVGGLAVAQAGYRPRSPIDVDVLVDGDARTTWRRLIDDALHVRRRRRSPS